MLTTAIISHNKRGPSSIPGKIGLSLKSLIREALIKAAKEAWQKRPPYSLLHCSRCWGLVSLPFTWSPVYPSLQHSKLYYSAVQYSEKQ